MFTGTVRVQKAITELAVAHRNMMFIGRRLMPTLLVGKDTDQYYVINKRNRFQIQETAAGDDDQANEVKVSSTTSTYACVANRLKAFYSDRKWDNSDLIIQNMMSRGEWLVDQLLLKEEYDIAQIVTTTTNYPVANRIAIADLWSDKVNSTPLQNIEDMINACFYPGTLAWAGHEAYTALKHHPDLLGRVTGGAYNANPAMINKMVIAEVLGLDELIVGSAKYDTSSKKTAAYDYVWGKKFGVMYMPQTFVEDAMFGVSFTYNPPATEDKMIMEGFNTRIYRDESRGGGGQYLEVEQYRDNKVVASDMGAISAVDVV